MSNKPLVMTSVRLEPELHKALRQIAFDSRRSLHSLLIEGAALVQRKYAAEEGSAGATWQPHSNGAPVAEHPNS